MLLPDKFVFDKEWLKKHADRDDGLEIAAGAKESYCPNCDAKLLDRGCKLRCPKCHYFMSCSEFD